MCLPLRSTVGNANSGNEPVPNWHLLAHLLPLLDQHSVTFTRIKGHALTGPQNTPHHSNMVGRYSNRGPLVGHIEGDIIDKEVRRLGGRRGGLEGDLHRLPLIAAEQRGDIGGVLQPARICGTL